MGFDAFSEGVHFLKSTEMHYCITTDRQAGVPVAGSNVNRGIV